MSHLRNMSLRDHVATEVALAEEHSAKNDLQIGFRHLERAHVLGQADTFDHTRVHWRMLKIGWRRRDVREVVGQVIRIIGAATKTPLGIYPTGNTGGSDVYFFKSMPIPDDLQAILDDSRTN